jgi:hypothetical protein
MKLRVTKGRIAVAVVLLPVLYVLSIGPAFYCHVHFTIHSDSTSAISTRVFPILYSPGIRLMSQTPLRQLYEAYLTWWVSLPPNPSDLVFKY